MNSNFDYHKFPKAYLSENKPAQDLRRGLIRNLTGVPECSEDDLSKIFFSSENIDIVNRQLILAIFKKTNNKIYISPQDPKKLLVVMRYIWKTYGRHLPYNIKKQVKDLNCMVVAELRDRVMSNATQKIDYLIEINTPRKILDPPINVNNLDKTLPSISELYHSRTGKDDNSTNIFSEER